MNARTKHRIVEGPDPSSLSEKNTFQFNRYDHTFISQGIHCKAWLYLPEGVNRPPVIVMAHGFGCQRWMRLPAYAEYFATHGLGVFLFDYRGFNDSGGKPRNYVNPSQHIEDWAAALDYVRSLASVATERIALWGTSFSAGHVMVIAARDPDISAIVLQVPFTDGVATALSYRLSFQLRNIYHGLIDQFSALFTRHRHNVRITSTPGGQFGMMSTPDAMPGMLKLMGMTHEQEYEPHNFCPANIAFTLTFYRPIRYAKKITCPALVIGAEKDTLFPPAGPRKAAERMNKATYISLPMTHFEPYVGPAFDKLVAQMADFVMSNIEERAQ